MSCSSNKAIITKISCPAVLHAAEHKNYIVGNTKPIDVENLSYWATINNHSFVHGCSKVDENFQSELSLLFLVKPDKSEESYITLPFYLAIINADEELIDMQYYQINGDLKKDSENKNYIETELITEVIIQMSHENSDDFTKNTIIIGFMLDKEKSEILN